MDKITLDQLVNALNIVGKQEAEESKEKTPEQIRQEAREELIEELKEKARKDQEENSSGEEGREEGGEEGGEEPVEVEDKEKPLIDRHLKLAFKSSGLDESVLDSLSEFLEYDKLKNEDGEADEDKISSLANLVSGVARKTPPKGSKRRSINDDGGLAKYLPKD